MVAGAVVVAVLLIVASSPYWLLIPLACACLARVLTDPTTLGLLGSTAPEYRRGGGPTKPSGARNRASALC